MKYDSRQGKSKAACQHNKRMRNFWTYYRIREERLQDMLHEQQGCCSLCNIDFGDLLKQYSIDHDHVTGKVRGLLCGNCNTMLGRIEQEAISPKRIADYLGLPWEML